MFTLTNRELATVIIFMAVVVLCLVVPKMRKVIAKSAGGVLRAFFVWQIQVALVLFYLYLVSLVLLAHHLGLWQVDQLKDTIILAIFTGLPLFFSVNTVKNEATFLRKIVKETIGVSAILLFYINLASLPLAGEIPLQLVVTFLVIIAVVASRKAEQRIVATTANVIMVLIGIGLLIYTTIHVIDTR